MVRRSRLSKKGSGSSIARLRREWDADKALQAEYMKYAKEDYPTFSLRQLRTVAFNDWVATVRGAS